MKKKYLYIVAAIAGIGLILGAGATAAFAVTNSTAKDQFVSLLAQKLGISEDKVNSAVTATRDELRTQREAEVKAALDTALKNGKITQKQYDIEIAMQAIMKEKMDSDPATRGKDIREDMINLLKAKGITATQTELDDLRSTLRDLGIGMMGRGMGMRGGMMGR